MRPTLLRALLLPVLLILVTTFAGVARAQEAADDGILVAGRTEVALVPTHAIVSLRVSASANTAKAALEEYAKKRQKLTEALAKVKGGSIQIGPARPVLGAMVDMQQIMMGNAPPENPDMEAKEEVAIQVRAVAGGSDDDPDLAALVSAVVDAGVALECPLAGSDASIQMMMWTGESVAPTRPIRYVVDDVAEPEQEAMARAIQDAAAQAGAVARITGLTLGRIVSLDAAGARLVTEFDSPTPPPQKLTIVVRYAIQ